MNRAVIQVLLCAEGRLLEANRETEVALALSAGVLFMEPN